MDVPLEEVKPEGGIWIKRNPSSRDGEGERDAAGRGSAEGPAAVVDLAVNIWTLILKFFSNLSNSIHHFPHHKSVSM